MFIHGKDHYRTIANKIADRLKQARNAKNVTITQLAARMGVRRSLIYNIEQKKSSMNVTTMLRVCDALDLSPGKLLVN